MTYPIVSDLGYEGVSTDLADDLDCGGQQDCFGQFRPYRVLLILLGAL